MPPFGSSPYAPRELYDYSPGSRISDIILRAGEARARAAEEQSALLGNLVSNLGQQAGQAIEANRARKQEQRIGEFVTAAQGEDFDIEAELAKMPPEMRVGAMETYGKIENARSQRDQRRALAEKHKAEMERLQREAEEDDAYRLAAGAHSLLVSLGTPGEAAARESTFKYFGREHPEQVAQLVSLSNEELAPVLQNFVQGSQKYQKELADLQAKQAEPAFKERELGLQESSRAETLRHNQAIEAQQAAELKETRRGHDLAAAKTSDKLVKVEHRDPESGRTVIEWLPQSEVRGQTYEKGLSGTEGLRVTAAQTVNDTGQELIAQLNTPELKKQLGPAMGRYNSLRQFIGNPPPELAEFAGRLESYALASMGVHGMRSAQGAEQIKQLLDKKQTPESLIATIRGLNSFSEQYIKNAGGATQPAKPITSTLTPAAQALADQIKARLAEKK